MKSLSTLATCNFGNFQFWQLAILATCNFGNLQFWQLTIWQLSILTTSSFDNFQFWLFSSKIFELIQQQQQQQHIDCMDLAIKNTYGQISQCDFITDFSTLWNSWEVFWPKSSSISVIKEYYAKSCPKPQDSELPDNNWKTKEVCVLCVPMY